MSWLPGIPVASSKPSKEGKEGEIIARAESKYLFDKRTFRHQYLLFRSKSTVLLFTRYPVQGRVLRQWKRPDGSPGPGCSFWESCHGDD